MSCYIYFYLKKKDTPMKDWHICLAHLCTTEARELAYELANYKEGETYHCNYDEDKNDDPNYGYYTPLTLTLLQNTIDYYFSKAEAMTQSKANYKKQLDEANSLYLKATSKAVLSDIKDDIREAKEMLEFCDEEIERFNHLGSYIQDAVKGVLEENIHYKYNKETNEHTPYNDYELAYYMG